MARPAHDWETTEAEVDLRVGGAVRVVMRDPEEDVEYGGGGHYTEIDPPTRLAFTWVWDDEPHETLIEIEFEETDGATTVRFAHNGLWDEEAVRSHEDGWGNCFDNLERALVAVAVEVVAVGELAPGLPEDLPAATREHLVEVALLGGPC